MAHAQRIDPRLALRGYAVLAVAAGFCIASWGTLWWGVDFAGHPWGKAILIRMAGVMVMAAGFCAMALAQGDAVTRGRALWWFIAAHAVVWAMLVAQLRATWDSPLGTQVAWALLAVMLGLAYVSIPNAEFMSGAISLFNPAPASQGDAARSRYEQQIRDLAAQEERNRLARELHDAIKQQVFAIQTSAATAEMRFDADRAGARDALAQVRQSAREAMAEMEAMLDHLRVVPIENAGLVEAIRKQAEALAFRTGARVDVQVGSLPPSGSLEPGAHQAMFRVTQEALGNVARHARALHVWLSIEASNGRFVIRIEDDGVGIDGGAASRGMGMQNMAARAAELSGTVTVTGRPAGGTAVTLAIPYETADVLVDRRRRARNQAVVFGLLALVAAIRLAMAGMSFGSVLLVIFAVGFADNLNLYRRLRQDAAAVS